MHVFHSNDGYANASQYHVTTIWLYGKCFYSYINDLYVTSLKSEMSLNLLLYVTNSVHTFITVIGIYSVSKGTCAYIHTLCSVEDTEY